MTAETRPETSTGVRKTLPSVSVVVVNYNGARHLPTCLDSLEALDYPRDSVEVVVVDNGSTDSSRQLLADRYPWVRVIPLEENLGFAGGNNTAAQRVSSDCLAFLNNDMEVEPSWLRELIAAYDPDAGYRCVGGVILNWHGDHLDFADGVVNYHGFGYQIGFGLPLSMVDLRHERELLFACGGAMLVQRRTFLDLGGFDAEFFAYFEDVDFGWRLWLAGHRVRLADRARSRHMHHGTTRSMPNFQRQLAFERNALRMLIKNLEEENLGRLLPAALLLLGERARSAARSDRSAYELGAAPTGKTELVSRNAIAALHAVGDIVDDLESLMTERRRVQALRQCDDAEIFERFGRPFAPARGLRNSQVAAMARVSQALRLDQLFEHRRATRLLVLAYDPIGERMAGPAVRCWEIASALAKTVHVTVASTSEVERTAPGVEREHLRDEEALADLAREADIIMLFGFDLARHPVLRKVPALKVIDLYDPWLFEQLENQQSLPALDGERMVRDTIDVQRELIDIGDFFVCASERQRDYWLGMLSARGRIDGNTYRADPTLRNLIDVVPYGCADSAPGTERPVLRGVHPEIPADAFLVLWTGGTWDWFDPLTVLEAFARLVHREPQARLYFMGLELPGRGVQPQRVVAELRRRARDLGLAGHQVLFGDWVPYDERGAYLTEADVGVLATHDLAEVRLSFRSRLLDHFWAGLPTVMTGGDSLSETIAAEGAGIVVGHGDVEAFSEALMRLAADEMLRAEMGTAAGRLADSYRWSDVVAPLLRVVEEPWRWRSMRENRASPVALTEDAQLLLRRWRKQHWAAKDESRRSARSSFDHTARALWWRVPEPARARVRPLLRRLQTRAR
jgi:GT2 family glycosyltransferase/glycosyltransferase involved in cell wall biosynthesis